MATRAMALFESWRRIAPVGPVPLTSFTFDATAITTGAQPQRHHVSLWSRRFAVPLTS